MERRKSPREMINYPVWVICTDLGDDMDAQSLAYVLNISESGMLIESSGLLRGRSIKILASASKPKIIQINGSIVYTDSSVKGRFRAGIQFIGSEDENLLFFRELIEAAHLLETDTGYAVDKIVS